jgi:hypothetical protein
MRQSGQTSPDLERNIGNEIENLKRKLGEAAGAVGEGDKNNRMTNNLDRARNLVRGVDSMQQQMREGQRGQQGQQGQQDQQGEGQQGQRRAAGSARPTRTSRVRRATGQQGQQGQGGQQDQGQQAGNRGGDNRDGGGRAGSATDGDGGGWGQRVIHPGDCTWRSSALLDRRGPASRSAAQRRREPGRSRRGSAMRQLDDDRVQGRASSGSRRGCRRVEGFEFTLRRKVEDSQGDQPALTATDEVPRIPRSGG